MTDGGPGPVPAAGAGPSGDAELVLDPVTPPVEAHTRLDPRRLRSLVGLTLARLGPRARGAVSGTFLALLVGEHSKSLFAVTFALMAHRIVTWIANPIAGRLSDKSETPIGRRVPYMSAGLLAVAGCVAAFTHAGGYWTLVALLVLARIAYVLYYVPSAAVTPETFGSSRWVRALAIVGIGGFLVGVSIRVTVIATWNQEDPTTWGPAYYLAAAYIAFAALAILVLVREAPSAQRLAHRAQHDHDPLAGVRSVMAAPNAKVLLIAICLALASGGAFEHVFPLYVRDVLSGGGRQLAWLNLAEIPLFALAAPGAWILAHKLTRKTSAVLAGITGAASAVAHFWVTDLWQSALLSAVSGAFLGAAVISLVPFYLQILPRRGGLGERIGLIVAPILVAGMIGAFTSAIAYDLLWQDYRVVWTITAIFALASGFTYLWLDVPAGAERANPTAMTRTLVRDLWGRSRGRHLFRGDLHMPDTDGTKLLERVADELNPYRTVADAKTDDVRLSETHGGGDA
jgi:MFS family permease